METREAVLAVLSEEDAPLHWTMIQDRALRAGWVDPFTTPDVRRAIHDALRALVHDGIVDRVATGVYELRGGT